jgi:hypothetical protein
MHRKNNLFIGLLLSVAGFLFLNAPAGAADLQIGKMPPPPETAKLRVFVLPVTASTPPSGWQGSHEEFSKNSHRQVASYLARTGIYQVIRRTDERQVVKGMEDVPHWQWARSDWRLAKEVGRALHADYIVVRERGVHHAKYMKMVLINLETEQVFEVEEHGVKGLPRMFDDVKFAVFNELFRISKADLLATAIRKGRIGPPGAGGGAVKESPGRGAAGDEQAAKPAAQTPGSAAKSKIPAVAAAAKPLPSGGGVRTKLVVYDLDTNEQLRVVGLILAEALREELLQLGVFTLVNRENIAKVMEEHKLQQSGLVDDSQILQLGKWLAAQQAVSGRISLLGESFVVQAKRIDLEKAETLKMASLQCPVSQQEKLLDDVSELARKLADAAP